jgi:hypothetical protein
VSKRRRSGPPPSRAGQPREKVREKVKDVYVPRPFAGLPDEPDWVALRELVPAATAPLRLSEKARAEYGDRDVTLATLLPLAWPGLVKPDGRIILGLQRHTQSGDVSRDVAVTLQRAFETEPGSPVQIPPLPGPGPRLQDLLSDDRLEVTVRDGFDFWVDEEASTPEVRASLERANASVFPTVRLTAAPAAYWCRFPEKAHVRWVLGDDEDLALATLSRLSRAGQLTLGPQTRFAGMFRAHGLLVPVWDLPTSPEADAWEEPVADFAARYATAREAGLDLDAEERRARAGLLGRQVALR